MAVTRRIYIIVIAVIVVLIIITRAIVWVDLNRQILENIPTIHRAAGQRTLSQNLTTDVLLLVSGGDDPRYQAYLDETSEELAEFRTHQAALQQKYESADSSSMGSVYEAIEPDFNRLAQGVECILVLHDYATNPACTESETVYLEQVLDANAPFLDGMETIVDELQVNAIADQQRISALQGGFAVLSVVVILGLAWFVIRPAVRRTEQSLKRLAENEQILQEQNLKLVKANRELAVARRDADEANQLKSQFLANMSHELRTPLNAVIGYSQLLTAGLVGDLTDDQYEYQERVLINARHLLGLINDVLDLSKIDAGRIELADVPFVVRDLLNEAVEQNRVLADKKALVLDLVVDPALPSTLYGDPNRFRQVVINLLSNAVKFTDKGHVHVKAESSGDVWRLIVEDTGIGIPDHLHHVIFDEFRQVHDDDEERGGTGLGLAITRKLVLAMNGKIEVSSKVGQGTRFTVTLPRRDEAQVQAENEALEKEIA